MDIIVFIAEITGTVAFAVAGTLVGVKHELDILGAFITGCITAVGGGCLRDVILGVTPPTMFRNPVYAAVAAGTSIFVSIVEYLVSKKRLPRFELYERFVNVFDAVGLAVFIVAGVKLSYRHGYGGNAFLTIFVASVGALGGGIMRDILVDTVPMILRKQVYATPIVGGAIAYYYISGLGVKDLILIPALTVCMVAVRVAAAQFRWNFPRFRMPPPEKQ